MMGEDDADDTSEGSFNSKSVWARISVIAAGPLFNFILALLMSAILVGAAGYAVPVIQEVESGSSGSEQGLKKGGCDHRDQWKENSIFMKSSSCTI